MLGSELFGAPWQPCNSRAREGRVYGRGPKVWQRSWRMRRSRRQPRPAPRLCIPAPPARLPETARNPREKKKKGWQRSWRMRRAALAVFLARPMAYVSRPRRPDFQKPRVEPRGRAAFLARRQGRKAPAAPWCILRARSARCKSAARKSARWRPREWEDAP